MAEEVGQLGAYRLLDGRHRGGRPRDGPPPPPTGCCVRPTEPDRRAGGTGGCRDQAETPPSTDELSSSWPPERLTASDEASTDAASEARRTSISMGTAWREFWRHPSPWMIGASLAAAVVARILVAAAARGGSSSSRPPWSRSSPSSSGCIHVAILHWRPRSVGPVRVDSLLARDHRAHHADPRDLPLVFIPWRALLWLLPAYVAVALAGDAHDGERVVAARVRVRHQGRPTSGPTTSIHSDYRPRSPWYRHVWRNHRLHHYKNEHYWFTVTSAGTADRLFGTYPDPATVPRSKTVRALHSAEPC